MTDAVWSGIEEMGASVVAQLAAARASLHAADLAGADAVVRGDAAVNAQRYQIEDRITAELGGAALGTERLRFLIAALSVSNDLERIGDHCEGIAKIALMLGATPTVELPESLHRLGDLTAGMLSRGITAFMHGQVVEARAICAEDDAVDELYDRIYGELLTAMASAPDSVVARTYILWAVHNFERIADRVTNICERTVYLVTGRVEELNVSNY